VAGHRWPLRALPEVCQKEQANGNLAERNQLRDFHSRQVHAIVAQGLYDKADESVQNQIREKNETVEWLSLPHQPEHYKQASVTHGLVYLRRVSGRVAKVGEHHCPRQHSRGAVAASGHKAAKTTDTLAYGQPRHTDVS
jgi:hypothetical protein